MEEIIDLDLNQDNVDFGSGAELLMNDKQKSTNKDISLDKELSELNEIEDVNIGKNTVKMDTQPSIPFKKISEINIEKEVQEVEHKTKEDLLKEKFNYLRKLEQLESKGVTLSKRYSMDSSLDEMKGEYEHIIFEKERSNSMKFQGKVLTTLITGLEFLNNKLDPFDIKLEGWSEQINENLEDYDDIFSELHEKYKSKAKMAPELKLLFQLAGSGMMIHMTNTMFKSAIPGMDDIMRQNPDLMNQFTKAAVSSMEEKSPGLSNFMSDFGMNQSSDAREDMKGPENIDQLLNQLNKKVDIEPKNDSTISVEDLENLSNASAPSTNRRKRKSDKNSIRLAV
ncbi:hypothetical protein 162319427 [Organic Lake phycodnavirus 2]|nr:hypothetical protein 162319427 [Organic Lake phycodnavirus 2]